MVIEWAQDVLNYIVALGSILEKVLWIFNVFFLDADNIFIELQHVWVVTCEFYVLITAVE